MNHDVTDTNEYSFVCIVMNTEEECREEMRGQLSDGIFENSGVGECREVNLSDLSDKELSAVASFHEFVTQTIHTH